MGHGVKSLTWVMPTTKEPVMEAIEKTKNGENSASSLGDKSIMSWEVIISVVL
jgi:hypothetical protein